MALSLFTEYLHVMPQEHVGLGDQERLKAGLQVPQDKFLRNPFIFLK